MLSRRGPGTGISRTGVSEARYNTPLPVGPTSLIIKSAPPELSAAMASSMMGQPTTTPTIPTGSQMALFRFDDGPASVALVYRVPFATIADAAALQLRFLWAVRRPGSNGTVFGDGSGWAPGTKTGSARVDVFLAYESVATGPVEELERLLLGSDYDASVSAQDPRALACNKQGEYTGAPACMSTVVTPQQVAEAPEEWNLGAAPLDGVAAMARQRSMDMLVCGAWLWAVVAATDR